jgi:hypothetical protein
LGQRADGDYRSRQAYDSTAVGSMITMQDFIHIRRQPTSLHFAGAGWVEAFQRKKEDRIAWN